MLLFKSKRVNEGSSTSAEADFPVAAVFRSNASPRFLRAPQGVIKDPSLPDTLISPPSLKTFFGLCDSQAERPEEGALHGGTHSSVVLLLAMKDCLTPSITL